MHPNNLLLETFKGKVRKISSDEKRVLVAKNHSVHDLQNSLSGLWLGDIVLCNYIRTIQRIDENQAMLKKHFV